MKQLFTGFAVRMKQRRMVISGVRKDVVSVSGGTQGRMSRLQDMQIQTQRHSGLLAEDAP